MDLIIQANQCSIMRQSILLTLGPDVLILIDPPCAVNVSYSHPGHVRHVWIFIELALPCLKEKRTKERTNKVILQQQKLWESGSQPGSHRGHF